VTAGLLSTSTPPEPAEAFPIAVPTLFADGHKPAPSPNQGTTRLIALNCEIEKLKPGWVFGVQVAIADVLAAGSERTMTGNGVARPGFAFRSDSYDRGETLSVEIAEGRSSPACQMLAVEAAIEAHSGKWGGRSLSRGSLGEASASADVVRVLVKHRPLIKASSELRKHARATDAVGLFASGVTRK